MKKHIMSFVSGIITTLLVISLINPAFASTVTKQIEATLNSINITIDSKKVASIGESYTLSNGKTTATSIVFNNTTYVPIRKVAEILGLNVGWDEGTSTASINSVNVTPEPQASIGIAPETVVVSDDLTYENFKNLWEIYHKSSSETNTTYIFQLKSNINIDSVKLYISNNPDTIKSYALEMYTEYYNNESQCYLKFHTVFPKNVSSSEEFNATRLFSTGSNKNSDGVAVSFFQIY
jgi:hypothetical protein